jgi:hypothetical protein
MTILIVVGVIVIRAAPFSIHTKLHALGAVRKSQLKTKKNLIKKMTP